MSPQTQIYNSFLPLWDDIKAADSMWVKKPLLAHYTSIGTLECIMRNEELWFSNPLFMNDLEELRFGVTEGTAIFRRHSGIFEACGSSDRYQRILQEFERLFTQFNSEHALDIYVFCMTEHEAKNTDGVLSMWRGYASNGSGAAIVIDSAKINYVPNSPIIFDKVAYLSREERLQWIDNKLNQFTQLMRQNYIPDNFLSEAVYYLFERIKIFALFTKHHGFKEEREWRAVYLRERDTSHILTKMLDYAVGRNGIEPKLKFKLNPVEGLTKPDLSLESVVEQIILGPTVSSPLAISSVKRMLEHLGKRSLSAKVVASTTPFRQTAQ